MEDALSGEGSLTLLAPSNAALAEIPAADLGALLADPERLQSILLYHVLTRSARMMLVTTVGDDYGTNWSGWSDAVAELLEASSDGVQGVGLLQ